MKCLCNNCSGEIQFEEEREGQTVACLHCEMDTVLYRQVVSHPAPTPTEKPGSPPKPSKTSTKEDLDQLLNKPSIELSRIVGAGIILLVFAFVFAGLLNSNINKGPGVELGAGILGFTLTIISMVFGIIWLVFPLVAYFQLEHIVRLLQHMARESKKPNTDKETS
ncbi:MAG: APC family permease [Verrucomicrobia bacterium]|jgi:hypothetical protein|nr:APC family permease [Verrucomicrobiota bacterium]